MAATTAGALKAYIEGLGLGISAYRDRAPDGALLPYITIMEDLNLVYEGAETYEPGNDKRTGVEMVQIDVWQGWRDPVTRAITESATLVSALLRALHICHLPAAPTPVYGVVVIGARRNLQIDVTPTTQTGITQAAGVVQTSITANVFRQI